MGFMLSSGLAAYAYVDSGQSQSRVERVDESAFNLGEGVLNAQTAVLSRNWPSGPSQAYPACTQAVADPSFCPQADAMAASFGSSVDYQTGAPAWTTTVHDDEDGAYFDPDAAADWPAYDANGNGSVWIRAEATFTVGPNAGRTRALVAQIDVQTVNVSVQFPERTLIAGRFQTTNNGNKIIVQTNATETSPHNVTLRCADVSGANVGCAKYRPPKQVTPPESISGGEYLDESGQPLPALSEASQDALKGQAVADGSYYAGSCPNASALAADLADGGVVWVETASCGTYTGNTTFGSPTAPGVLVLGEGGVSFGGTTKFYGVIYALNRLGLGADNWLVDLGGNTEITGRIFVDGWAGVSAGSSKVNITYDDFRDVEQSLTSFGTASIVQNSWREIVPAAN
jgi:hypothetical protein